MKFRETKAWTYTMILYWMLVFGTAAFYYWLSAIKSFR